MVLSKGLPSPEYRIKTVWISLSFEERKGYKKSDVKNDDDDVKKKNFRSHVLTFHLYN